MTPDGCKGENSPDDWRPKTDYRACKSSCDEERYPPTIILVSGFLHVAWRTEDDMRLECLKVVGLLRIALTHAEAAQWAFAATGVLCRHQGHPPL